MTLRQVVAAVFVAAVLVFSSGAAAGIDVELRNGDRVVGTLNPADTVETYRFGAPEGVNLRIDVKGIGARASSPRPTFELLNAAGESIADKAIKRASRGATLRKFVVPKTAEYTLRVTGDGRNKGKYEVLVKWKLSRKVRGKKAFVNQRAGLTFPADAGTVIDLRAKAKGSGDLRIARLRRLEGGFDLTFDEPAKATTEMLRDVELPATGRYRATIESAAGRKVDVQVVVREFGNKPARVNLTDKVIGTGATAEEDGDAVGEVISSDGGEIVADEEDGVLAGAAIEVEAGATVKPVAVIITTKEDVEPPPDIDIEDQGGPAVAFEPNGTKFDEPVQATVPIDVEVFETDYTRVVVVREDKNGNVTVVPPAEYVINAQTGTVTITTNELSTFQVKAKKPPVPNDVNGDGFGDLIVNAGNFAGDDGSLYVFFGGPDFDPSTTADAEINLYAAPSTTFGVDFFTTDVEGDGIVDIVAGDFFSEPGAIYVYRGGPALTSTNDFRADADIVITGTAGEFFGAPTRVADVFGNGSRTMFAGAGAANSFQGAIYGFPFDADLASGGIELASVTIDGSTTDEQLGFIFEPGDVTGDGIADLVAYVAGTSPHSDIHVFKGGSAFDPEDISDADINYLDAGPINGRRLLLGDVTGDGVSDIIYGDRFNVASEAHGGVRVLTGGATLTGGTGDDVSVTLSTANPPTGFSFVVFKVFDMNGDGVDDILASSITESVTSRLFIQYGGTDLGDGDFKDADHEIVETSPPGVGGFPLAPFDVNGDGHLDLIYGVAGDERGGTEAGAIFIFFGGPDFDPPVGTDMDDADVIILGQPGEMIGSGF